MNLEKNMRNIFGHAIFAAAVISIPLIKDTLFLAYRIGESVDLPVHGKPYLSPQCMDDFRFSDVT